MKKVAIIGIQGVPASYGGFESLVENIIGENQSSDISYTIYCSSKDMKTILPEYKGAKLRYIPLHANGIQSIPYDIWAMLRSIRGFDTILVLGTSGCLFLPFLKLLSGKRLVVNIDGLEHRREKWGKLARWVLKTSEKMAVRFADVIISDNKGIQDYVTDTYGKYSEMIAYGGDHVLRNVTLAKQQDFLNLYGLSAGEYAIKVCRIEPENNCQIVLEAFARSGKQLVFIGNWNKSEYARQLRDKYKDIPNIMILDAIYDLDILYTLRLNAKYYVHGHSAGGTNPSLVEAMFFGRPILAYDVVYNRETTKQEAYYFKTVEDLVELLERNDLIGERMSEIAWENYTWRKIAKAYEKLY